ncbi:PAP2 superfamily protein [Saccharicrinis carchari]|uniref:PAP2 superfamily protein n=1 Tax=Saccharicrinis carchari TaxID=1168039 RepID=A0A521CMN4_SACCC|nr:phosphatase PAP2 family protein [Saccharicrinis carchari]SMO59950.1 PAP2 superfamily protein [Saccharicrinis carchari]
MGSKLSYYMKILLGIIMSILLYGVVVYAQSDALGHEKWEYVLEDSGDILQIAIPVSAGLITLLKEDYKGTKSLALSYGTTLALSYTFKHITKLKRPEGRNRFDSFPSAHTSSAFSGASFLQRRYGWNYGWPAYLLATIVAVSRTEGPDGYHTVWDVLGGAAMGIGSTYLFTKPYENPKLEFGLSVNRSSRILTIRYIL